MAQEALISPEEQRYSGMIVGMKDAEDLAIIANGFFDRRNIAASKLASIAVRGLMEREFTVADDSFELHKKAAEVRMPGVEAFDNDITAMLAMSSEQRTKAAEVRRALASGGLKDYGVTEESLRVVMIKDDGKKHFTLIHTGPGIDIGDPDRITDPARSFSSVMSEKKRCIISG